jgi:hypothetical protein
MADPQRVRRWLDRSRSDLALAGDVVGRVDRDRAMAIALRGQASRPALLGQDVRPLLRRIDGARQFRNEILYGDAPASESQLAQLIGDAGELLARLSRFLDAVKS